MVKIITIHGTNAGRPEDHGDQWWQKGSPFEQRIQQLIEEPVEFAPFHWPGANSERQRRKAGAKLAKLIAKQAEPSIVVGHSHGGSVAAHALFHLHLRARRNFGEKVRALITVGTPMLRFKGTANPLARLHPIGQLVLLVAIALALSWTIDQLSDGYDAILPWLAGAAAATLGVFHLFIRRSMRRSSTFRGNRIAAALDGRYAPLNHSIDEAVLALKSVRGVRLSFLKAGNLRGGVRSVLFPGFIVVWSISHLTLSFNGASPYEQASAERTEALYKSEPGATDARNDMIVRLAPGHMLFSSGGNGPIYSGYGEAQLMAQFRKHVGPPGPEYGRAFAKGDYVVIDYATAYAKRDFKAVKDHISGASRTASASYFCWRSGGGQCEFHAAALYLTPEARDLLLAAAVKLADADATSQFAAPVIVGAAPNLDPRWRRIPAWSYAQVDPASAKFFFVEMRAGQSPFDEVLGSVDQRELDKGALVSRRSLPPPQVPFFAARSYPMIERGDEIVVPRNMGTSYYLQCGAAKALGFNPMIEGQSVFLRTVLTQAADEATTSAYCDQFAFLSNGLFEIYRALFTTLGVKAIDLVFLSSPIFLGSDNAWLLAMSATGIAVFSAAAFLALVIGPLVFIESVAAALAAIGVRSIATAQLKNAVYGNDGYGEQIAAVAPGIDFEQREIGTLPPGVEEKISEHSLRYAEAALRKVREIISLSAVNQTSPMLADLSSSLTWQELIHTAYFDVPEFKEHFAKELARIGGLTLRADPPPDRWAGSSLSSANALTG